MSEFYTPPEAQDEPPKKTLESKKGFFEAFKSYADKRLVSLALAAGIFFGSMGGAEARKAQVSDPEGRKDETHETEKGGKFDIDETKEIKNGEVRYRHVYTGEQTIGRQRAKEYFTVLDVHDEGDLGIKGDEKDIRYSILRYDDATGKKVFSNPQVEVRGEFNAGENPFGVGALFESPESVKKSPLSEELARLDVDFKLKELWAKLQVVRAFRGIKKDFTPEGCNALADLAEGMHSFAKEYPDIPIPRELFKEVFGE